MVFQKQELLRCTKFSKPIKIIHTKIKTQIMNKNQYTKLFTLILALVFIVSCKSPSKLYPYHTTVQGIYGLEVGMTMSSVESTLGNIKPYDIKANFDDGYKVIEYKYKIVIKGRFTEPNPFIKNIFKKRFFCLCFNKNIKS